MILNFKGVKTNNFETLPAGMYPVSVYSMKIKTSNTGKQMIEWVLQVEDTRYPGRRLFLNTLLSSDGLWKTKQTLMAIGFSEEELEGEFELDPSDMVGMGAMALVSLETYQGAVRNKVERLSPIPQAEAETDHAEPESVNVVEGVVVEPQAPVVASKYTKAAQAFANEAGIDITLVTGTGPGGKVTRADVEAFNANIDLDAVAEESLHNGIPDNPALASF